MAMEIQNYSGIYENTYVAQKKQATKREEVKESSETKVKTANKSNNEEYLKKLQKQVPYMKLQIGYGVNTKNDGKVDVLDINPKLLEKMQNNPKAAKEYTQRLKDVESAHKYADNFLKAAGSTVICSHAYVDENGNYCNFTVSVRKDALNEKLRKEAQENAEKRIEKSRENARKSAEQLAEKPEENSEDTKTIIEEAKEDNQEKIDMKKSVATGTNFDMQI